MITVARATKPTPHRRTRAATRRTVSRIRASPAQDRQDDRDRDDRGGEQTGLFDDNRRAETGPSDRHDQTADRDERDELSPPAEQPAEDAQPVGGLVEELNPETPAEEAEETAPRKSARGRGGKGRGGKAAPKPAKAAPAKKAKAAAEAPAKARGRGGRARGKGGKAAEAPAEAASEAGAKSPAPATPEPVVRTGSTDRHHLIVDEIADEPILTPEPRRPRTYRDLDEIPDDLD